MSKLDDLIEKLCPNGVEYRTFKDFMKSMPKGTLKQNELVDNGMYPVINSGRDYYGFYNNYNNDTDVITIASRGEYAGFIHYSSEKFWAGGLCYPFKSKDSSILTKYIYYYLKNIEKYIRDSIVAEGSIPALNKADVEKIEIPVPPLPIQEEIVRILDNFTELTAELTAELQDRKKQYEYYRDSLLTFNNDIEFKTLEELCNIVDYRGKTPRKVDKGIFLVTAKNIRKGYIDYDSSKEYIAPDDYDEVMRRGLPKIGDVLFTTEAPCGNVAQVDNENIALAQRVIKYRPKDESLNASYLKHYMLSNHFQSILHMKSTGGTVEGIKGSVLHQLTIPVPSTEIQERIVNVLDNFEKICNDLKIGLPAEIELRQKQYEYYRDMLLTFPENDLHLSKQAS